MKIDKYRELEEYFDMLPIDLVLVRHGQSEGNVAKRLSEKGDHSSFTAEFLNRHTSSFRLSELGCKQAVMAGEFLVREFFGGQCGFDRYYTSEYIRAMETAGLLNLPGAEWLCDVYLTERDWGDLDNLPEDRRKAEFGEALRLRDTEPFFWRPPNGESFLQLCQRVDRFLHTLHRECCDKRVIVTCHGEVMWAFRVRLERMSQVRFRELHLSKDQCDRIYNCQVIHYTRRDPETNKLARHANWMRTVRPAENPIWSTGWQAIDRPRYSNEALLSVVRHILPMIS